MGVIIVLIISVNWYFKDPADRDLPVGPTIADDSSSTTEGKTGDIPGNIEEKGILRVYDKKMAAQKEELDRLKEANEEKEKRYGKAIDQLRQDMNVKFREIIEQISQQQRKAIESSYYDGLNKEFSNDPMATELSDKQYTESTGVLLDRSDGPNSTFQSESPMPILDKQAGRFPVTHYKDAGSYIDLTHRPTLNPGYDTATEGTLDNLTLPDTLIPTTNTTAANQGFRSAVETSSNSAPIEATTIHSDSDNVETNTVAALSFTSGKLLHGISCPIGAALVNKPSGLPGRPVIIPITGSFKTPEGVIIDIGKAHIWGLCGGYRTDNPEKGRAEIALKKISYWDAEGNAHHDNISGYLIDPIDNAIGLGGSIDKASRYAMIEASKAAALASYALTLSQKEFTTVVDSGQGTRFLDGDDVKASGASGIGAFLMRNAEHWEKEANSSFDSVLLPADKAIQLIIDSPLTITVGKNPMDTANNNGSDYIPLI